MFFRKKPADPVEITFKERVERFWSEFSIRARDLSSLAARSGSGDLREETTALVSEFSPAFDWIYGPGISTADHSLTLSPNGCRHHRLLTEYWAKRAPALEGWNFFPSRQPGPLVAIHTEANSFQPAEIWFSPEVNESEQLVHLTLWCPRFVDLGKDDQWWVCHLLLDAALGEDQVNHRIGELEISDSRPENSMPLPELRSFVEGAGKRMNWANVDPLHPVDFHFHQPSEEYPRADIVEGRTRQHPLWSAFMESHGRMEDPLEDSGAAYFFLRFPLGILPAGKDGMANERFRLEEHFSAILEASGDGLCLGGGISPRFGYIDFLLFDGPHSIAKVMETLREDGVVKEATLHRFAGDPSEIVASL